MTGRSASVSADSDEWRELLQIVRHDAYHVPAYVQLEARALEGEALAFTYSEGTNALLLPIVLRDIPGTKWRDALSPYGYPGVASNVGVDDEAFWANAATALAAELSSLNALTCFVRMNALLPFPVPVLEKVGRVVGHGETIAIDLTLDYEQMWAMTRSNHRRQISRTRRSGMKTIVDDWTQLDTFVDIYHETMRRVGATDFYFFPRGYFDELQSAMCGDVHLMLVESAEGAIACGGIFFERCGIIQYHLGATRNEALSIAPTKQMFDDVRMWGKERGNTVLHLGGGVSVEGGNPLFHFKAGFSDWHLPVHTWRIVTDERAYAELCVAHAPGVDIGDVTQFFPLYRRPAA